MTEVPLSMRDYEIQVTYLDPRNVVEVDWRNSNETSIHQVKINPYRRLIVPASIPLPLLHSALVVVFGLENVKTYVFEVGDGDQIHFGRRSVGKAVIPDEEVKLFQIAQRAGHYVRWNVVSQNPVVAKFRMYISHHFVDYEGPSPTCVQGEGVVNSMWLGCDEANSTLDRLPEIVQIRAHRALMDVAELMAELV